MYEKPFIKLIRSPYSGYFFDVNRNDIIPISNDIYFALEKQQNNLDISDISAETLTKIEELKFDGYLSSNKVKKIEHPYAKDLSTILQDCEEMLCIQVTQNCNLRCEYCIYSESNNKKQRSHDNKSIHLDVCKQAVDFLFDHSKNSATVTVGFYGGEPLLEFDKLREIIEYSEALFEGRDVRFNMTTNAILLTPDVVDYLFSHSVAITISLDGPKKIHDKYRNINGIGSFDKLIENLYYIYHKYPEKLEGMHISMVINRENDFDEINSIFSDYPFFKEMGLMSNYVDESYMDIPYQVSERYLEKSEYNSFIAFMHQFGRVDKSKVSPISYNPANKILDQLQTMRPSQSLGETSSPSGPCIAGNRRLFCNIYGDLFPCERLSETSKIMKIGTIFEGFDKKAALNLMNVAQVTADECKNCWAFALCTQCIRSADGDTHIDRQKRLSYCNGVRGEAEYFLHYCAMTHEIEHFRKAKMEE